MSGSTPDMWFMSDFSRTHSSRTLDTTSYVSYHLQHGVDDEADCAGAA